MRSVVNYLLPKLRGRRLIYLQAVAFDRVTAVEESRALSDLAELGLIKTEGDLWVLTDPGRRFAREYWKDLNPSKPIAP